MFNFKRLFSILWPVSILALPWQTRWIVDQASLSGFPWEQGTIAFYVSWVVMIAVIVLGFICYPVSLPKALPTTSFIQRLKRHAFVLVAFIVLVVATGMTTSWSATGMWWTQVVIASLFVWTLVRAQVSFVRMAVWFVVSLVPHAAIGFFQYFHQDTFSSSWLGMANHHPWDHGTSVVEHGLYRVLRAYGGFPHPNIFGGWLAVALTVIPFLVSRAQTSWARIGLMLTSGVFAFILLVTYGRGAWIAGAIGFSVAMIMAFRRGDEVDRLRLASVAFVMVAALGLGMFSEWDHLSARFELSNRLESWSVQTRILSIRDGIDVANQRQIFGWGPGAGQVGIAAHRAQNPKIFFIQSEPPHIAPLAGIVDLGFVGFIALFFIAWLLLRGVFQLIPVTVKGIRLKLPVFHPLILVFVLLASLDHYFWTLWSGHTLFAVIAILALRWQRERSSEAVKIEGPVVS
ncbi:MAG: O-antigen ligase family protein [Candidatus Uhrbacteria bacterium]|nr:O-antigen ligase family protein [Candidatus Uhrbacteria bacterium]